MKIRPKEISWLSFNARVLQEAADPSVPLINRIRFLGIYSSNLDEFFEVRVATLQRLAELDRKQMDILTSPPKKILEKIDKIVIEQRREFGRIYSEILAELEKRNIFLINEKSIPPAHIEYVKKYFKSEVRPRIFPVRIRQAISFPDIVDKSLYLAVRMYRNSSEEIKNHYCIVQIPAEVLPRFVELPSIDEKRYIIMLDDIIRFSMKEIFQAYAWDTFEAFEFKLNRDAELDIDDDISESYLNKINKSLQKRKKGEPVRLSYDAAMPKDMLETIRKKLKLDENDAVVAGGRYQNSKDLMKFPDIINEKGESYSQAIQKDLAEASSILSVIAQKDILIHFPYQPFDYVIDLLREASIDSKVTSIKITLYRLAKYSSVINALINARRNNIDVTVILELQARFDEEANINWANKLQEEGIHVIFGVQGLKIHSKLCMITRIEKDGKKKNRKNYCVIGTGNFNEFTARIYTDHYLLTSDPRLTTEVASLFDFLEKPYKLGKFRHLIVSPFNSRARFKKLIKNEIANAAAGKEAYIWLKLNNLADEELISRLYQASSKKVTIRIIGRGMFSLAASEKGLSENIEAIGIVDKFLEHDRTYIFCNGGDPLYFISSADWMPRNLDRRIEVTCPVYDESLKDELRQIFELSWSDNVKARILDSGLTNMFRELTGERMRSQTAIYEYLKRINSVF